MIKATSQSIGLVCKNHLISPNLDVNAPRRIRPLLPSLLLLVACLSPVLAQVPDSSLPDSSGKDSSPADSSPADNDWWSLQPLNRPEPPAIKNDSWGVNEIDRFIVAALRKNGLRPSPPADPRTLVRRIYVDLIGLPAPAAVIDRFAADPSPEAWTKLVNELLASKHYGERWARHWMDIARFGESEGYEHNHPRSNLWHYRDWLIRAFNSDMPYDEFATMQLAGDILQPETLEGAAATGFLVAGTHNTVLGVSETMQLASRHDELEEIAGTVGQTFLGMTINCARCHDHKFDPITEREYYQFIAALDGVKHGERKFPWQTESSRLYQQIASRRDGVQQELVEKILTRGGIPSKTANIVTLKTPVAANVKAQSFRVSFSLAPTVWAAPSQATSDRDGIVVEIVRENGSVLAKKRTRPGAWNSDESSTSFQKVDMDYVGDGNGDVRIRLRPVPLNSNRFGGAIDDLVIVHVDSGESVFKETFDDFQRPNAPGNQAHTDRPVFYGAISDRWEHTGTNTLHAVEHSDGNLALQIFGGTGGVDAITAQTSSERKLQFGLSALDKQIALIPSLGVYTVVAEDPGVMHVYQSGDVFRPGEEVAAGGMAAIRNIDASWGLDKSAPDSERRVRLAEWITHRDNALFHRVAVNRFWHYHFGQGLVTSTSDFGFNGGRPSHPGLLDWLSVWFRENGYSIKELHRLIVTSATYQQASLTRADGERIDKDNRLLWRQNARRVEAEVLRDSILMVAGQLNLKQFGPGYRDVDVIEVPPAYYYIATNPIGVEFNRRTIYRWNVRGQRSALLDTFDCPDPSTKTPTRLVTTTPSQALSHWNDRFITRMSEYLANRIEFEAGFRAENQASHAWRLALGRSPTNSERESAAKLIRNHGLPLLCRVLFNSNEFILID